MNLSKKILVAFTVLIFLCVLVTPSFIGLSPEPSTQGNNPKYLNASKFHLSPASSQQIFKRYPTGLIPLPLKSADANLLKDYSKTGGYIVEFSDTLATHVNTRLTGPSTKEKTKEASIQKQIVASDHRSFTKELTDNHIDAKIKREYSTIFNGVSLWNVSQEDIIKISGMQDVAKVYPLNTYKVLLSESLEMIGAPDAWKMQDESGRTITGKGVKIAIIDTGVDYTHGDLGSCTAEEIDGSALALHASDYSLESSHPYLNGTNHTWTITMPGYSRIAVHFRNVSMEDGFDVVYVRNASGGIVQELTGEQKNLWTVSVPGDTIYVNFVSDDSVDDWGFSIDGILNGSNDYSSAGCAKVVSGYDFVGEDNNPMDDYGHGTHCAGIAAGNGVLKGVAPDAQILDYKVCDAGGSCAEDDIIAGIERAVLDGADVISMSLGGEGDIADALSKSVDNAVDSGVVVAAAAGNSGPANASVECPGCARKAIAVGAVYKPSDPQRGRLSNLTVMGSIMNSMAFKYSATTAHEGIEDPLTDAKIGLASDYSGRDCTGKIALIERMENRITFHDQVQNAYDAGCIGAIVYDTDAVPYADDTFWTLGNLSMIPAVWVNKSEGEYLKDIALTGMHAQLTVTVDPFLIAEFSSRGPFDIYDKPDVVAPGVNICAARMGLAFSDQTTCIDEHHILLSGTSMATPHVAGAAALLIQKNPTWLPLEIKAALKNTATDYGYSPKDQGAGLINVPAALALTSPPPVAYLSNVSDLVYRSLK